MTLTQKAYAARRLDIFRQYRTRGKSTQADHPMVIEDLGFGDSNQGAHDLRIVLATLSAHSLDSIFWTNARLTKPVEVERSPQHLRAERGRIAVLIM